jgi:hypothetical protein
LSHQRGKKISQVQTQCSFSFNSFGVNPSALSPGVGVSVVVLMSHQRKKKKGVWRQLCECLSEAAAHLLPTVSQLLLQALFIADLRNELYTHLALQAMFI